MTPHTDIQAEIRRFLLGTLSEDARRLVEERLMTEEAFLDEVTQAESELVDDYVVGLLDDAERADFERHFLSTDERRRRLRFTQSLADYADAHAHTLSDVGEVAETDVTPEPSPRPAPTFGEKLRAFWGGLSAPARAGLAFACVAVIVGAFWFARPPAPTSFNDAFPALVLAPGSGERSTGPKNPSAPLPPEGGGLKLVLTLPEGSGAAPAAYRADLVTSTNQVSPVEVIGRDERSVSVVVHKAQLTRGRYAVKLYAADADKTGPPLDSYLFEVK